MFFPLWFAQAAKANKVTLSTELHRTSGSRLIASSRASLWLAHFYFLREFYLETIANLGEIYRRSGSTSDLPKQTCDQHMRTKPLDLNPEIHNNYPCLSSMFYFYQGLSTSLTSSFFGPRSFNSCKERRRMAFFTTISWHHGTRGSIQNESLFHRLRNNSAVYSIPLATSGLLD